MPKRTATVDQIQAGGYHDREVTQPPNWHGLVAWDLLLNNLATGTFLVAALGELASSALVRVTQWAYPLAWVFLMADLACLVLDLGDPLRFHHMLRVVKLGSPMSLGTWCLSVFSLPLTGLVVLGVASGVGWSEPRWVHLVLVVAGLLPVLGSAAYKGVLFSTSSQPGWKDARWLGGYLMNSAFLLGAGVTWMLASLSGDSPASARLLPAFRVLVVLNLVPLGLMLAGMRPNLGASSSFVRDATGIGVVGTLATLALTMTGPWLEAAISPITLAVVVLGQYLIRSRLVKLPHLAHH